MMWVFAGLCICFGLCMAGFSRIVTPELIASAPQAQAAQLQEQIRRVEDQLHVPFRTALLLGGLQMLIPGFALGGLAFWVRRGGRGAAVVSASVTGLLLAIVLTQLFLGGGGPQVLPALCVIGVPIILLGATLKWLIEAARNAPQIAMARASRPSVQQPGNYAEGASGPHQGWQAPPYPTGNWPGADPPNAPSSPPSAGAPVRYGYAQPPAPTVPQPPAGDTPIEPMPPGSSRDPDAGSRDSGGADRG